MLRGLPEGERWAVVSDIHANASAFRAVLPLLEGADRIIVLGDMLSYGAEPEPCMELLASLYTSHRVDLVLGNHDQLYIDLLKGETAYYDRLPDWLRELADWTLARVDPAWFQTLPWRERVACEDLLFAHANPWTYGDWRYLNSAADCSEAAATLSQAGFRLGAFGHTHRALLFARTLRAAEACALPLEGFEESPLVLNPGSLGQPRNADKKPSFVWLRRDAIHLHVAFDWVDYDSGAHVDALARSGLSQPTLARLSRYLRG